MYNGRYEYTTREALLVIVLSQARSTRIVNVKGKEETSSSGRAELEARG
jgi:hypothetical protein